MKKWLILLPLILLSLVGCIEITPNTSNTLVDGKPVDLTCCEVKGEWLYCDDIIDMGEDAADKIFARSASNGVTDVYLLVKGTRGRISFLNSNTALDKVDYDGRDLLQEAIASAHKYGIRLNAWVSVCSDDLYKQHFTNSGNYHFVRGYDNSWINPNDEGYRTYLCSLLTELVNNYDIDGVCFDYLRYNHVCNGWSNSDIQGMISSTDQEVTESDIKELINKTFYDSDTDSEYIFNQYREGNPAALAIAKYRQKSIKSLEDLLVNTIKEADPSLIVSRTLSLESTELIRGELHYGLLYSGTTSLCDYVIPMTYTTDYYTESSWITSSLIRLVDNGYKHVVPALQSYYPTTSTNVVNDTEAVRVLLNNDDYKDAVMGMSYFRIGTYSYAKISYYERLNTLKFDVTNALADYDYNIIKIDLQDGLKAKEVKLVEGLNDDASVIIQNDGKTVLLVVSSFDDNSLELSIATSPLLLANSSCLFDIEVEGNVDLNGVLALVSVFAENESRALHSFMHVPAE